MTRKNIRILVVLGLVLLLSHVIGIPLVWKEWVSAALGIFCIGWGLYLRYGAGNASYRNEPHV